MKWLTVLLALVFVAGCAGGGPSSQSSGSSGFMPRAVHLPATGSPIQHVVIIVQENRTFDNIFHEFEGPNSGRFGYTHTGAKFRCTRPIGRVPICGTIGRTP